LGGCGGAVLPQEHAMTTWMTFPGATGSGHLLCFRSLFVDGRGLAFPCDAQGWVDLDGLGDRLRLNYLYARVMIGREFHLPQIEIAAPLH
jgi:hypothetical protein